MKINPELTSSEYSDAVIFEKENSYNNVTISLILDSIPTILYYASIYAVYSANLHFIGQYNDEYLLDGVGIATTLINCTTIALICSLNIGFVSIASQAYGSKDYRLVGIYFHRALLLNLTLCAICFGILAFSNYILYLFEVPPQTRDYAYQYITYFYGSLFASVVFDTLKSYLICQGIYVPMMVIQFFICASEWVGCYYFVSYKQMGIAGIAISNTISEGTGALSMLLYIIIKNPLPESWLWFTKDSFKGIWALFKYEAPMGAMVYLEWIAYEITLIFSGSYSPDQLAAQVIIFIVSGIFYNIPYGMGVAYNSSVGSAVGEKNLIKIKRLLKIGLVINIAVVFIITPSMYFSKQFIAQFFTSDLQTIDTVNQIINIYCFILPVDCTQYMLGGYIRGIGRAKVGTVCFMVCYYLIGLPLAFVLGNVLHYYDIGLWIGIGIAVYCLCISFTFTVCRTDLSKQIMSINKRIMKDKDELEGSADNTLLLS